MPTFHREDISPLHFILSATLAPSDYEPDFDAELGKYRKQAALKGFRKGKTPAAVLRKMFGKSVLADVLNNKLQRAIAEYVRQNNLDMLGGPIPSDENDEIAIDIREMKEYTFKFEIGVAPEFEIAGAGPESTYSRYAVDITDDMVEQELRYIREQNPREEAVEENFLDNDIIQFEVAELDGDAPRENGLTSSFEASPAQIIDEALRVQVMSAKKGDTLRVNMFNAFDVDEKVLFHNWLGLAEINRDDIGEWFQATILSATRAEPAELNQEFFDALFGPGKVSTEAEAQEQLRKDLEQMYLRPANSLMFVEIRERLLAENQFPLPEAFLKKWMAYNNEDMEAEAIEAGFDKFLEGLRWNLMRNKLADQLGVEVNDEELEEHFRRRVRGYFGANPYINEDFIADMARRLMEREEGVREAYDEIFTDKLFYAIAGQVNITPKPISKEAFDVEMEAARQRYQPAPQPAVDAGQDIEVETVSTDDQE